MTCFNDKQANQRSILKQRKANQSTDSRTVVFLCSWTNLPAQVDLVIFSCLYDMNIKIHWRKTLFYVNNYHQVPQRLKTIFCWNTILKKVAYHGICIGIGYLAFTLTVRQLLPVLTIQSGANTLAASIAFIKLHLL